MLWWYESGDGIYCGGDMKVVMVFTVVMAMMVVMVAWWHGGTEK